jgi:hypothetical protein
MFGITRVRTITTLIGILLIGTACAQAEPATTQSASASLPQGAPTPVVVRILNLDLPALAASATSDLPEPTPLPTMAPLPSPKPTSEASASEPGLPTPACVNLAEFVKSLSVSDNSAFKPEQSFAKIWQIKNTGTCTWTTGYSLVYASGEAMSSPALIPLPNAVSPGETIDLRLNLIAPVTPKTYTGNWYLQDQSGAVFGLGPDGTQPIALTIIVKPIPKPPI